MSNSEPLSRTNNSNSAEILGINEMDVRDFLTKNPNFFISNYDLLDALAFPANGSEQGTSSLVDKQINFLRERNLELRNRLNSFINIARNNDSVLKQTRRIILSLISHKNLDDFQGALKYGLLKVYQVDQARLVLFTNTEVTNLDPDIMQVDTLSNAKKVIPALTELKKPLCGNLRSNELAYFFGEAAPRVGSVALIPLNYKKVRGFIIAGKSDPLHFKASMDTLFFETLASSIERVMHKSYADQFNAS